MFLFTLTLDMIINHLSTELSGKQYVSPGPSKQVLTGWMLDEISGPCDRGLKQE